MSRLLLELILLLIHVRWKWWNDLVLFQQSFRHLKNNQESPSKAHILEAQEWLVKAEDLKDQRFMGQQEVVVNKQ